MDAYTISRLYSLWTTTDVTTGYTGKTAITTTLTTSNILDIFDEMMTNMDEARVPANGRLLYVTSQVKAMLKKAVGLSRTFDTQKGGSAIDRTISRIEEVEIISVPSILMKSAYTFTTGWTPASGCSQINMLLVHPEAVITPVSYQFSKLDPPSAVTQGKYFYYEESFEDVFILNKKADALQFHITNP